MQSEEDKRRRLAALQQQQGIRVQTPLQRMTPPKAPTAQQIVQMRFPTAIRNVPVPKQPTPSLFERAVETVLPNLGVLGRSYGQALGEITGVNESARRAQQQSLQLGTDIIRNLNQRLQDPNLSQAQRQNIQSSIGRIAQSDIRLAEQMGQTATEQAQALDPAKIAAAYGLTALDIATLGGVSQVPKGLARLRVATPAARRATTIGGGAAIGGVYGPLDTLTRKGSEATPEELAQSAAIGGVAGAAIPATFGLFGRLVQPVRRLLGRETAQQVAQRTTREAEQAATERATREATQQAGETAAQRAAREAIPTPAPAAGRSVAFVSDDAVTNIVTRKSQADIDKAVRDIYPDIDVPSLNAASDAIKKAASPTEVRAVLDSVAEIKRTIDENLPTTTVPTTGTQITTARLAEEITQPTGATRITQAPEQPQAPSLPTTPQPTAPKIEIPGAERYRETPAFKSIEEQTARYEQQRASKDKNIIQRVFRVAKRELLNPTYYLQQLDDSLTRMQGRRLGDINPLQSLAFLKRRVDNSPDDFKSLAIAPTRTGESYADVVNKYIGKNDGKDFVQYLINRFALEIFEKSGNKKSMWKIKGATPEEVKNIISRYERNNPTAPQDAATIKAWADSLTDYGVANGQITREVGEILKNSYDNYVPLNRVFSEDKIMPTVSGGMGFNVSRQNVARYLTEGAADYDNSFTALNTRGQQIIQRSNQNVFNKELYRRVKAGEIDNVELVLDPDVSRALKARGEKVKFDPKTIRGANVIKGFDDGEMFVLRIDDVELAKQLEYLNNFYSSGWGKTASALSKLSTPQKIVATGIGAPQFLVKSAVRQQALKLTNVPGLSAFGARPATIGYAQGLAQRGQVYDNLVNAGFSPPKATKVAYSEQLGAKQLASYANRAERLNYVATNPREWWNSINSFAAKTDIADRTQIGYAAYLRAKRQNPNITEAEAWARGSNAANTALGDFRNVSQVARSMEVLTPYSGATQAGYRALMRSFRERPYETTAKVAALLAPVVYFTYSQAERYKDFYEDLIKDGRTDELDNNIIILNPFSAPDPETGDWTNITKIPLAPDFRPINRAAWKTGLALASGQAPDTTMIASEMANFITASQKDSFWGDPNFTSGVGQILPNSPVKTYIMIGLGLNPNTGEPLADEALARKARNEQFTDYTSDNAKKVSDFLGGFLTPQQLDSLGDKFGIIGDMLQSRNGLEEAAIAPFRRIFNEVNTKTPQQRIGIGYFKDLEEINKNIIKDNKQFRLYQALKTKKTDNFGQKTENTVYDKSAESMIILSSPEIQQAEVYLNQKAVERGNPSNPLWDNTLTPEQRQAVLTYRSMRVNNAAKQNYTKNGESAFVSLGLDDAWYDEFKKEEDAFWTAIKDSKNTGKDATIKTFSGTPAPQASPELQQKLDFYYTIPKGTGQRSAFLAANPDVTDFWGKQNDFTNEERAALGFKPLENMFTGYTSSGGGSARPYQNREYLGMLLDQVAALKPLGTIAGIKAKQVKQYKIKLPSTTRRGARIKLQ